MIINNVLLSLLPPEVLFYKILPFFEYSWILQTARLVCKEWNANYKNIPSFYFPLEFDSELSNSEQMLKSIITDHVDELSKVTILYLYHYEPRRRGGGDNSKMIELERELISKLKNLKKLYLTRCDPSFVEEILKITSLESIEMKYVDYEIVLELVKCERIKFSFLDIDRIDEIILSNDRFQLEKLLMNSLAIPSLEFVMKSKSVQNLQVFQVNSQVIEKPIFKYLSCIHSLIDIECRVDDLSGCDDLKCISELENLRYLACIDSVCNDTSGVSYLSKLEHLKSLDLSNNQIIGDGFNNFGKLKNLTRLVLQRNKIGNQGANYLTSITSLNYLDLGGNSISDEGLKNFCNLSQLTDLSLNFNNIGSEGASYLASNENLTRLDISNNSSIGEHSLQHFVNLTNLKQLELNCTNIGNSIRHLSKCKNLTSLSSNSNNITDDQVVIEICDSLINLQHLTLSGNDLSEKCCESISKLQNLNSLLISNNQRIGDLGFSYFGKLPNITVLHAGSCGITDEGIVQFFKLCNQSRKSNKKIVLQIKGNNFSDNILEELHSNVNILDTVIILRRFAKSELLDSLSSKINFIYIFDFSMVN